MSIVPIAVKEIKDLPRERALGSPLLCRILSYLDTSYLEPTEPGIDLPLRSSLLNESSELAKANLKLLNPEIICLQTPKNKGREGSLYKIVFQEERGYEPL
jgi:hypothetical protein